MDDEKRIIKDQKNLFVSACPGAGKPSFFWVCLAIILGVTQGLSGI
jgi:hypothetical protein